MARLDCNCSHSIAPGGQYAFGNLQSFFANTPTSLTAPIPAAENEYPGFSYADRYGRQTNLSIYIQDDWKVSRRLTLNLGLRDDYISNPTEATGVLFRITDLDPFTSSNNTITLQPTLVRANTAWNYCCTPYQQEWSATVQRQLPGQLMVSLGYIGSVGIHLTAEQNYNVNLPVPGTQARPLSPTQVATLASKGLPCTPACNQGYNANDDGAGLVPNVTFGPIEGPAPHLNSNYNSGVLTVQRSLGKGIQFQSSFTYSRCLDYGSDESAGFDGSNDSQAWVFPYFPKSQNYGLCAFNISKNWSTNALIPLPFHGNQFKEGWQLAAIAHWQTGVAITPALGGSLDQENLGNTQYLGERPNYVPSAGSGPFYTHTVTQWFNPSYFQLQAPGQLDNAPRSSIIAPGLSDMDFTVMKTTMIRRLGEGSSVEIRADFFNVFNHPNFGLPAGGVFNGSIGAGTPNTTAGTISTLTTSARQLQFSARLVF